MRWTCTEVNTTNTYEFEINPSEATSPTRRRQFSYQNTAGSSGKVLFFEGGMEPVTMQASGTLLTQAQYLALDNWSQQRTMIDIVDDLGRSFRSIITNFEPERSPRRGYPWAHDYTLDYTVIREN